MILLHIKILIKANEMVYLMQKKYSKNKDKWINTNYVPN